MKQVDELNTSLRLENEALIKELGREKTDLHSQQVKYEQLLTKKLEKLDQAKEKEKESMDKVV